MYTHTHAHRYIYIYIYIYRERERERERERKRETVNKVYSINLLNFAKTVDNKDLCQLF